MVGFFAPLIVTHAYIFISGSSTTPHGVASTPPERSPTPSGLKPEGAASVPGLIPAHFRRRVARPVSCYALFKGMAASKPTSWLS